MRKTMVLALAVMSACVFGQAGGGAGVDVRFRDVHTNTRPTPHPASFADKAAWEAREDFLRHQVLVANGLWPMPEKMPLNAVVHGKIDKGDFTIEKVYFASMPGHYVTGNLYRPKNIAPGAKVPAVLQPYGHWPGGRFWWRDDPGIKKEMDGKFEVSVEAARSPLQATSANLAHMGCVVFEWDLIGYADSTVIKHQEGFTDPEAVQRLQSFLGLQSWNGIRAYDFVASLPEVDAKRIAVGGSSGGATQTMQLGAVDDRIAAFFPIVMVSMHNQGGCVCENAPLLRVGTSNVEIAALMAPRPQGDCGATGDNTADYEKNDFPMMKNIYDLLGVKDNVEAYTITGPHNHNLMSRELFYNFINKTFNLGIPGTIKEVPIEPVDVKQLSVWDDEHKLPADFMDAKTLREVMTKASDAQMAALAKKPAEYAVVLKTALQAMIVDKMPGAGDVEFSGDVNGMMIKGFLSRRGTGERVPEAFVKPANWNGTVVLWADPRGSGVLATDQMPAEVKQVLDSGAAVLAIDAFMSAPFMVAASGRGPAGARLNYSAYSNGYERTILANRVHDLLTAVAYAKSMPEAKSVRIVATAGAGVQALLATGLAGDAVEKAAIDLDHFDFANVKENSDPNLLPGALKYGNVPAWASLAAMHTRLAITNTPKNFTFPQSANLSISMEAATPASKVGWVLQK